MLRKEIKQESALGKKIETLKETAPSFHNKLQKLNPKKRQNNLLTAPVEKQHTSMNIVSSHLLSWVKAW